MVLGNVYFMRYLYLLLDIQKLKSRFHALYPSCKNRRFSFYYYYTENQLSHWKLIWPGFWICSKAVDNRMKTIFNFSVFIYMYIVLQHLCICMLRIVYRSSTLPLSKITMWRVLFSLVTILVLTTYFITRKHMEIILLGIVQDPCIHEMHF